MPFLFVGYFEIKIIHACCHMHRSNKMTITSKARGFLLFWEIPTWVQVSLCPRLYVSWFVNTSRLKTCDSVVETATFVIFTTISPLLNVHCKWKFKLGKKKILFSKDQKQFFFFRLLRNYRFWQFLTSIYLSTQYKVYYKHCYQFLLH